MGGDEGMAQELLEKFIELLPQSEAAIRESYEVRDLHNLYETVHKLAGSASIVGAAVVSRAARALMDILKEADVVPSRVEEGYGVLLQSIADFTAHFDS